MTKLTRRSTLWSAAAFAVCGAAQKSPRGVVAFRYSAVFTTAEIQWYSRFELLVTGAIVAPDQTSRLLNAGCRLVAYEWSSAFYPGDPVSSPLAWQEKVLANKRQWLITDEPQTGGAAEAGKPAYWYDFADTQLCSERAQYLTERIVANGYAGVFLDTPGFEQLPEIVRRAFLARHPGVDYNRAQGRFFERLRTFLGNNRILFSNQGYRQPDAFLPYADYDLTESYITAQSGNRTLFRPWHDPQAPWESVRTPMEQLVMSASRGYPRVRFVHLGYAGSSPPDIARAIRYNYAAAKMWNHDAYLVSGSSAGEHDEIYQADLGRPLTESYEQAGNAVAWRHFERGLVALNSSSHPIRILNGRVELPPGPVGVLLPP